MDKFENIISCLILGWMSLSIGCISYVVMNESKSTMFAIGPNDQFYILGIGINTMPKYWTVVVEHSI